MRPLHAAGSEPACMWLAWAQAHPPPCARMSCCAWLALLPCDRMAPARSCRHASACMHAAPRPGVRQRAARVVAGDQDPGRGGHGLLGSIGPACGCDDSVMVHCSWCAALARHTHVSGGHAAGEQPRTQPRQCVHASLMRLQAVRVAEQPGATLQHYLVGCP